jgi:hypothetical protein
MNLERRVVGLNKIFIDRAQEPVIHKPELMEKLPKGENNRTAYTDLGKRETSKTCYILFTREEN